MRQQEFRSRSVAERARAAPTAIETIDKGWVQGGGSLNNPMTNPVGWSNDTANTFRLYTDLAWLWPMWGAPEEYADYCRHAMRLIAEHARIPVRSLLNIGCGGGKNVFNLKRELEVVGLDLSPRMLELARTLNPECEFLQGDMRTFALERTFDAVLLDDAITYMATRTELKAAFTAAWRHLKPGGVMVAYPDDTKESFVQNRTDVTPATAQIKPANIEVVFVENNYDPDTEDDHYEATIIYLIREDGKLRMETDRHIHGLFALATWREALTEVGFTVDEQRYTENGRDYATFACLKPK